jgi:uncharacterized protein (TIGR03067 family)
MGSVFLGLALVIGAPALKEKEKPPTLEGEWEVQSVTSNGNMTLNSSGLRYTFTGDGKWLIQRNGAESSPTLNRGFTSDPKQNPPTVDLITNVAAVNGSRLLGIFKIEGDTLTICGTRTKGGERPTKFEAPEGSGLTLYVLKRANKE